MPYPVYYSVQSAFDDIQRTIYERNNNIKILKKWFIFQKEDNAIVGTTTSNGETGLYVILKVGLNKWVRFPPTKIHFEIIFPLLLKCYKQVEKEKQNGGYKNE